MSQFYLKKISMNIDYDISPRPYSLEEYQKATEGDFLYQEIIKKGKPMETICPTYRPSLLLQLLAPRHKRECRGATFSGA